MKKFIRNHWKKFVLLLVLIGIGFAIWKYFANPLLAKLKGETINPSDVYTVKKGRVEVLFSASGTITAKQDIKVTSKPSGILKAIYVKEGEHVRKGQKLGLIKPGKNEFEDYKPMPIYAEAEGTVIKCVNSEDYRKSLSDKDLSLPRLGTFLTGTYDNVSSATCFMRIVNMDSLLISAYVTENEVMKLKTGMPVDVKVNSLSGMGARTKGKLSYISTQIETTGRWGDSSGFLIITELENPDHKILLGVSAEMSITIDKKEDVLTIPANALFEKGGKNYVFKYLGGNKTEKTEIQIGLTSDRNVEVRQGLSENDQVLTTLPYGESW